MQRAISGGGMCAVEWDVPWRPKNCTFKVLATMQDRYVRRKTTKKKEKKTTTTQELDTLGEKVPEWSGHRMEDMIWKNYVHNMWKTFEPFFFSYIITFWSQYIALVLWWRLPFRTASCINYRGWIIWLRYYRTPPYSIRTKHSIVLVGVF